MAANAADYFKKASNGVRPVPTTLSAIHSTGGTTLTCVALTGWATTTGVSFCVYTTDTNGNKVAGTQTDWSGVVSGSTITNIVLKGGTDQNYSIGAVVEAAPIAGWADDIATGALVQHNQDGTHAAVTATSVTATGDINASTVSSLKDTGIALSTYRNEDAVNYTVANTGVWSGDAYASTRNASMTAWTGYINGQRGTISAVTAHSFTASKDTYVDVLNTVGVFTLVYTEVTNNAASPALASNSIRIAIIVTGASNIADVGSVNQGQPSKVLPIASSVPYSVSDSLGNRIYQLNPSAGLVAYRQGGAHGGQASIYTIPEIVVPVIVPAGRTIEIDASAIVIESGTSTVEHTAITISEDGNALSPIGYGNVGGVSANNQSNPSTVIFRTPTAGLHTYTMVASNGGGTSQSIISSQLAVKLV